MAQTGVIAYWRNRRIGGNWPIYNINSSINSSMALAHSETLYIVGNIILLYKIKWLRDGKRWYIDIGIRSHHLY